MLSSLDSMSQVSTSRNLKRPHNEVLDDDPAPKRQRRASKDRLSRLSDELILRIFSYLPVSHLCRCQRLSSKFHAIAGDSQLWKAAYYRRFVRPRAAKVPRSKDVGFPPSQLSLSSKLSKWLDEENLVKRGKETNWKRQYKLRHNWSKGSCGVSEIRVTDPPPAPPLLVRLHEGVIVTADSVSGLRAWSAKPERRLLASMQFGNKGSDQSVKPTALAVDLGSRNSADHRALVGFDNGDFSIYAVDAVHGVFLHMYTRIGSSNERLVGVAFSSPYLLTMNAHQLLSLYKIDWREQLFDPPRLLYSLKSHTLWQPLSLAIRSTSTNIVATVAYALPTYLSGWAVGLQELILSPDGTLLQSRLASATDNKFRSLSTSLPPSSPSSRSISPSPTLSRGPSTRSAEFFSQPTSLSYTHPYLLASHPDNTLTLYLVTSNSSSLTISTGSRLWGHTSSVSGAQVGGRGKAVSVSSRGEELRVWELEGGLLSASNRKSMLSQEFSVKIRPVDKIPSTVDNLDLASASVEFGTDGLGLAMSSRQEQENLSRGWVGFDDENVIVLRENGQGAQALVIYDFT